MRESDKCLTVNTGSIKRHPGLCFPDDPALKGMMSKALSGKLHIYYAAIPFSLVRPFSRAALEKTRFSTIGHIAIQDITERWKRGIFHKMLVYQKGCLFVAPDDYFAYAACAIGEPDFIPCWVLGRPNHRLVTDVQGPFDPRYAREILFGTNEPGKIKVRMI